MSLRVVQIADELARQRRMLGQTSPERVTPVRGQDQDIGTRA